MPAPAPKFVGNTSILFEQVESAKITYGDKVTQTKVYRGVYALCASSALHKGTIGTGDLENWHVDACSVDREPRGVGKLTIVWVAGGVGGDNGSTATFSLPPDEVGLDAMEINPALEKNPFYSALTDAQISAVKKAFDNPHLDEPIAAAGSLTTLQKNLLAKLRKGVSSFYLAGIKYSWTQHFWSISGHVSLGGFIDTPDGPLTSLLPVSLSALRQADAVVFTGEHFKYTKTWLLAPDGHWDTDLYS